jgi:hypothetical protein
MKNSLVAAAGSILAGIASTFVLVIGRSDLSVDVHLHNMPVSLSTDSLNLRIGSPTTVHDAFRA